MSTHATPAFGAGHSQDGLSHSGKIPDFLTMTPEQIVALASDAASASAGKALATQRKWLNLGADARAVWGECRGSGSKPYQAQIDTSEPAFKCSCPSRKFPCKHGLGLYLLFAAQKELFAASTAPEWVEKWLESRQSRAVHAAQKSTDTVQKEANPAAVAKRSANRENKVEAGLRELELWMIDLVRNGLAGAPAQPYSFWDAMAARLVDAQCPALARRVRELASVTSAGRDWQLELLSRLAAIHLIVQGWKRRADLSEGLVAELRAQIGWTIKEEELDASGALEDEWWVLGQRTTEEDGIRVIKSWLRGVESQKMALGLQFAHASQSLVPQFVPFTRLRATVVFYPGATPLRASFRDKSAISQWENPDCSFAVSIAQASESYARSLAKNPWLDWLPVALKKVTLVRDRASWLARDDDGDAWPISPLSGEPWTWLATSGGLPVTLFGEWNGLALRPFAWAVNNGLHC